MFLFVEYGYPWNNGPSGDTITDDSHPSCGDVPYSTHDWIADHARALLPDDEREWLDNSKKMYLLGTEAPDNDNIPDSCHAPNNGYDDRRKGHSVTWDQDFSDFFIDSHGNKADRAAFRAKDEYLKAKSSVRNGDLSDAAYYLGAMAHYIGDVSQYGHSVDFEAHHGDYEGVISRRTDSFNAGEFEQYIEADGLTQINAYDAVVIVSKATAGGEWNIQSAEWMDENYNTNTQEYWDSVGASLNVGVNVLGDVLHNFYIENEEFINNPSGGDASEPVTYIVKPGDTLGSIAREFYGDGRRWRTILHANSDKVDNPRNLQVGTELVIP